MKENIFLTTTKTSRGAASIFVVIFTMLIVSTIVVGFTGIMLREQAQSSDMDLSQTAYDSALAGVEDAKRAVAKYNKGCRDGGTAPASDCAKWEDAFTKCNSNNVILYNSPGTEERIITTLQSSTKQKDLNQAYTCVKTSINTPDYIGKDLPEGQQVFIPLRGAGEFSAIKISWFSRDNVNRELTGSSRDKVNLVSKVADPATASPELPYNNTTDWPTNRPPVLRTQFVQVPTGFSLTDFDESSTDGTQSNTNSLFMYPTSGAATDQTSGDLADVAPRFNNTAAPWEVTCKSQLNTDGYACSAVLNIPATYGGAPALSSFLVLRPFYNLTDYKVELLNGAGVVNFAGVQPMVDSTGRANDIFRRVAARIEVASSSAMMPVGAVESNGNFCKTFSVTDQVTGYSPGDCDPAAGL